MLHDLLHNLQGFIAANTNKLPASLERTAEDVKERESAWLRCEIGRLMQESIPTTDGVSHGMRAALGESSLTSESDDDDSKANDGARGSGPKGTVLNTKPGGPLTAEEAARIGDERSG